MPSDTAKYKTIPIEFYRIMTTCPLRLDQCESLRANDSILIFKLDSAFNDLRAINSNLMNDIEENRIELIRRRKNVFKGTFAGFFIGAVGTIIALLVK
jgi:hypothetical protein